MWYLSEISFIRKLYQVYFYENTDAKGNTMADCTISIYIPFPETIFLQCSDGF